MTNFLKSGRLVFAVVGLGLLCLLAVAFGVKEAKSQEAGCVMPAMPYAEGVEYMESTYGEVPALSAVMAGGAGVVVMFVSPTTRTWTLTVLRRDGCLIPVRPPVHGTGYTLTAPVAGTPIAD